MDERNGGDGVEGKEVCEGVEEGANRDRGWVTEGEDCTGMHSAISKQKGK